MFLDFSYSSMQGLILLIVLIFSGRAFRENWIKKEKIGFLNLQALQNEFQNREKNRYKKKKEKMRKNRGGTGPAIDSDSLAPPIKGETLPQKPICLTSNFQIKK